MRLFRRGRPDTHPLFSADVSTEDPSSSLVRQLVMAVQIRRLRGADDARVRAQALLALSRLRAAAEDGPSVRISRSGPHLYVNGRRILPRPDLRFAVAALSGDWERAGIGGFDIDADIPVEALEAFLERVPQLGRTPADSSPTPGVRLLPRDGAVPEAPGEEDARDQARRTLFLALSAARQVLRQLAGRSVPDLRISRAVVHELIDTLVGAEFSLVGMSAIQDFDQYTFQHSVHVSVLSLVLGRSLGMSRGDLADLGVAALLHDLGKVHLPKAVLTKTAPFDARDWTVVQGHPLLGARDLARRGAVSDLAEKIMVVCAEHHVRHDGSGYPRVEGEGRQSTLAAMVSIADCFDAMTAARAYVRRPLTPDAVIGQMRERSGTSFDPLLLRLFVAKVGLYPVGSVLRLENGDLALVAEPPRDGSGVVWPRVRILRRSAEAWLLDEDRQTAASGPAGVRIRATCHPLDLDLDVDGLLSRYYFHESGAVTPPCARS